MAKVDAFGGTLCAPSRGRNRPSEGCVAKSIFAALGRSVVG